ncbi:interleukin-4 [Ictidomys tridecemlineatus]
MGLTPLLIATLFCLLVCPGNFTHGCDVTLEEIIKTLNTLSGKKTTCMELMVADVFAVPKNTTEKEILCRVTTVLRQTYQDHPVSRCLNKNGKLDILKLLRGLYRNLRSMAQLVTRQWHRARHITLSEPLLAVTHCPETAAHPEGRQGLVLQIPALEVEVASCWTPNQARRREVPVCQLFRPHELDQADRHSGETWMLLMQPNVMFLLQHNSPASESKQRTLKDFLESLKTTMQKKYSQCGRSKF